MAKFIVKKAFKLHVYGKIMANVRFKWEFLKIENEQIKTPQNDSYGQKIAWNVLK